jgi:hypothetical protein
MQVQLQLRSSRTIAGALSPTRIRPASGFVSDRRGLVGTGLSKLPGHLAVLTTSSLAWLVVGVRGLICGSVSREACAPKERVGLEIFR